MRVPLFAATLSLLVLSIAAAGCGGSWPPSTQEKPLSAAEWRREANAICRDVGNRVRAVPQPEAESEIFSFVAAVLPLWKRQGDQIGALVPPPELASNAANYLTALDQLEQALVEIHVSTQRDDERRRSDADRKSESAAEQMRLQARTLAVGACTRQRIP